VKETRDAALIGNEFARERTREAGDVSVEELDVTTAGEASRHLDRIGADTAPAAGAETRVYELDGLDAESVGTLRAAALGTDATVVVGENGSSALVFGSLAGLDALARSAETDGTPLDGALSVFARRGK
ncbi:MAG: dihydropteroate synthase, partial [Halobaculum sp.]